MNFTGTYLKTNSNRWVFILGLVNRNMKTNLNIPVICQMLGVEFSVIEPVLLEAGATFEDDINSVYFIATAPDENTIRKMIEAMDAFILPFKMGN